MKIPRRFSISLATALVVLSSSVFLFPAKTYAQTPVGSLDQNQQVIELLNQKKIEKSTQLTQTEQEIQDLELKKQTLAQQLEEAKKQVDELNQKLADKKAAAEAEAKRVEQLKNMFVHINGYAADSAGNLYTPGNCTWYAKSRRPDLPNNLGNANTWYARAAAQGWSVGLTPKKGAIATTTAGWAGHVAYVEGVSLDGLYVTISEMNYRGLYSMNTRTVYYTEFKYIYELD